MNTIFRHFKIQILGVGHHHADAPDPSPGDTQMSAILDEDAVSLASVEREIGVSEGYLSRIRKTAEPSFQLVALLALVADNPDAALSRIHALRENIAR